MLMTRAAALKEAVVREELAGDLHLYSTVVRAVFTETLVRVRTDGTSRFERQVKRPKTERQGMSKFLKSNVLF